MSGVKTLNVNIFRAVNMINKATGTRSFQHVTNKADLTAKGSPIRLSPVILHIASWEFNIAILVNKLN
jgi:hypothetical protein